MKTSAARRSSKLRYNNAAEEISILNFRLKFLKLTQRI
jgi:hypothetical protein